MVALGVSFLRGGDNWFADAAAIWTLGIAANYVPLALHASSLIRPGILAAELDGVDVSAELRHYTVAQFWVLVPLLLVILAVRQQRHR